MVDLGGSPRLKGIGFFYFDIQNFRKIVSHLDTAPTLCVCLSLSHREREREREREKLVCKGFCQTDGSQCITVAVKKDIYQRFPHQLTALMVMGYTVCENVRRQKSQNMYYMLLWL